ncbi:SAM-dependent methyltransferase [Cryptosporangium sp. NPDC048952]|uniref:SAM-dependent methyltransferase n=1 Tax=Cryptosporangium sp. NPDC048952 TaxID=3363961 RepID=UPI00371EB89A
MSNGTPTGKHTGTAAIDTSIAHPARRYEYWLGGKNNFAADRESGDAIAQVFPTIRTAALENRAFAQRAVRWLVTEVGIRQFIDLGCGIPISPNTHEVAQAIAPESRVVYVDNDSIVGVHARALLTRHPRGRTTFLRADLRDPHDIMHNPQLIAGLDFDRPIAVLMNAILHFIPATPNALDGDPDRTAAELIRSYLNPLPPGSHLVLTHATGDHMTPTDARKITQALTRGGADFQLRTREQLAGLLQGQRLLQPGVVSVTDWRPDDHPQPWSSTEDVSMWAAIASNSADT